MDEETQNDNEIMEIISWDIPEYEKHDRPKLWYILFAIVAVALLIYALLTGNFLFAIIIIIASFVLIMNDARTPREVSIAITSEGIIVGRKFYDYDDLQNFSIVYKPAYNVKQLYFRFKNRSKHHVSIPLLDVNPLFLRDNLLKYLTEDLEQTEQPTTESIAKVLKL